MNEEKQSLDVKLKGSKALPKSRKEIAEFGKEVKKVAARRMSVLEHTIEILKQKLEEYRYVDVSKYAASAIGVSEATLMRAIVNLELSGVAERYYIPLEQKFTDKKVTLRVLAPKGTHFVEIMKIRHGGIHRIETPPEQRQRLIEERNSRAIEKSLTHGLEGEAKERALRTIKKTRDRNLMTKRIVAMKDAGYSNVAIGEALGVSESTVRRILKPFKAQDDKVKILLAAGQEALEDGREDILKYFTEIPEFQEIFGEGFGEAYILRIHTTERSVQINPTKKRVSFRLEFWAQNEAQG